MSAPVISAWSAVSPYGVGRAEFSDGIRTARTAIGTLDRAEYPGPFDEAGLVPGFSAAAALGKKGTRSMDRVTALAVTVVGKLLDECGPELTGRPEQVGLVLGTGSGSVQSIMDFTRDSLTGDKPYHVDPARFPNTVMNRAAGQSAIWHGIKGPNTTIAGGWLTGLLALSYAMRIYRAGRCARVLCGAAEEYSVQRAWLEWRGRGGAGPLGEGAGVMVFESEDSAREAGRAPVAKVLAIRFGAFGAAADAGRTLTGLVREVLDGTGSDPAAVRIVAPVDDASDFGEVERSAVVEALGSDDQRWVRCRPLIGDTSAAATSLQLAAALSMAGDAAPGDLALVTAIDPDGGTAGCALLSVAGR